MAGLNPHSTFDSINRIMEHRCSLTDSSIGRTRALHLRMQGKGEWEGPFRIRPLGHCLIFGCLITLEIMYLLIVFLPLLGSSVAGFFGRFLGSEGTAIITTTCVSFSSIFSLIAFYEVALGASACYLRVAPWISSEMFDASWGFFGDREVTG